MKLVHPRAVLCCLARVGERVSLWIVIMLVVFSPVIYWGVLNGLGPSSEYSEPRVEVAGEVRSVIYLGEPWQVVYRVRRHEINGSCYLPIYRFAEYVGGPLDGQRLLINHVVIRFEGSNEVFYPRWPSTPHPITRGYDASGRNVPLMPDGVDDQLIDLYVIARYHCNPLDDFMAWLEDTGWGIAKGRYLQGGKEPNRTAGVLVLLRRHKP